MYKTLEDAVRGVLVDACTIATSVGHRFAIVGGWSPVLLNSRPIPHPGTRDVDILFEHGASRGHLKDVILALIEHGYHPSAKHSFQLMRLVQAGGREVVVGIDLLHPQEQVLQGAIPDMFRDHVELDVPLSAATRDKLAMRSIVTPHAGFILEGEEFEMVTVEAERPDAEMVATEVPVINELALLVTKSSSIGNSKRWRDSFDVYLAIQQARDYGRLVEGARSLSGERPDIFEQLKGIQDVLDDESVRFNERVKFYMPEELTNDQEDFSAPIRRFLVDAGMPTAK